MVDRFLLWLGAGAVCAGVAVGMLAGAGVAHAKTDSDVDGGAKTSQSAKTVENKSDSDNDGALTKHRQKHDVNVEKTDSDPVAKADVDADKENVAKVGDHNGPRSGADKRTAKLVSNVVAAMTHTHERKAVVDNTDPVETAPAETVDAVETKTVVAADPATAVRPRAVAQRMLNVAAVKPTQSTIALATPMLAPSEVTSAAAPTIDVPPAISAIGTAVFGLISFAESVFEGPPRALPGSGVTVKRSTLDLGDGTVVPADWYFPASYDPNSDVAPDRIIYLQHGFLARGVFYDYTASYLAQQTNSIVVAPSLTSNIFATDGMWLGGAQMHLAVADLFLDGNPALLTSAQAAGYTQDALPQNVVLVGHSLGGGLVIDVAGLMAVDEASGRSRYKLAGVLMLDGVSFTDPVPILQAIPDGIPVYNLSSTPYVWNLFGTMDAALAQVRGDQFHGAQLLGGLHSDSMIGGNPLVQFGAYLLTGFSRPSNAAGSQILAAGWINDMFAGTRTCSPTTSCFYGQPGGSFTIPTSAGTAIGLVQPQPGVVDSLARQLTALSFGLLAHINFATGAPDIQETRSSVEISA